MDWWDLWWSLPRKEGMGLRNQAAPGSMQYLAGTSWTRCHEMILWLLARLGKGPWRGPTAAFWSLLLLGRDARGGRGHFEHLKTRGKENTRDDGTICRPTLVWLSYQTKFCLRATSMRGLVNLQCEEPHSGKEWSRGRKDTKGHLWLCNCRMALDRNWVWSRKEKKKMKEWKTRDK